MGDAWEQFKQKQNVLAEEMHREWEKLKQHQDIKKELSLYV